MCHGTFASCGPGTIRQQTMPQPRHPEEFEKTASQQSKKRRSANRPADIFERHYMLDSHTMLS